MGKEELRPSAGIDLNTVQGRLRAAREHREIKSARKLIKRIHEVTGTQYNAGYGSVAESKGAGKKYLADVAKTLNVRASWLQYGTGDPFDAASSDLDLEAQVFIEAIAGAVNDLTFTQRLQVSHLVTQMAQETRAQRERDKIKRNALSDEEAELVRRWRMTDPAERATLLTGFASEPSAAPDEPETPAEAPDLPRRQERPV